MKRVLWVLAGMLILAAAGYTFRPRPLLVAVGAPVRITVREYIAEEAKTRLDAEYLIDMPIAGTLERIEWKAGDMLEAGAIIARIESFELERQIRGMESLIAQARAQVTGVDSGKPKPEDLAAAALRIREASDALRIAEKDKTIAEIDFADAERAVQRARSLRAEGVVSQAELEEAERRYKGLEQNIARVRLVAQAAAKQLEIATLNEQRLRGSVDDNEFMRTVYEADIVRVEAELEVLRRDLERAIIRAPVAGPILEKYIEDRRVLPPGTPIVKMGELATLEIECDVLSEEVVKVKPGNPVEISGKALGDAVHSGTVKRIYPSAFMKISALGIEQQRVKVIIAFDEPVPALRPGTRLDVKIVTAESPDVLAVPERATFRREGQWYVFTAENGRARMRPVAIGLKNDDWAEIASGLDPESAVITEPRNDLDDHARVRPRP